MITKIILPVVLLLGIAATPSLAQQYDRGSVDEQAACTPDVFRLCSAHIPDVPSIVACLKTEKRRLSPECRGVVERKNLRRVKS